MDLIHLAPYRDQWRAAVIRAPITYFTLRIDLFFILIYITSLKHF
jgi:hypothetical protein